MSDGWMGGWIDGWVNGWVEGWVGRWIDGWIEGIIFNSNSLVVRVSISFQFLVQNIWDSEKWRSLLSVS